MKLGSHALLNPVNWREKQRLPPMEDDSLHSPTCDQVNLESAMFVSTISRLCSFWAIYLFSRLLVVHLSAIRSVQLTVA